MTLKTVHASPPTEADTVPVHSGLFGLLAAAGLLLAASAGAIYLVNHDGIDPAFVTGQNRTIEH